MSQNTYTVTTAEGGVVKVEGQGASHDRDGLTIYADAEGRDVAAVFRRWEHVTVGRDEDAEPAEWQQIEAQLNDPVQRRLVQDLILHVLSEHTPQTCTARKYGGRNVAGKRATVL